MAWRWTLIGVLGLWLGLGGAAQQVRVLALFPDKAMLDIDGKRRVLKAGDTSPEGVQLLSASPSEATVRWEGQERVLRPGGAVSATYAQAEKREVRIVRDNRGSYTAHGSINGQPVHFLVDTGASGVAMSAEKAKALGIPYRLVGTQTAIGTAGGVVSGYRVLLDRVKVGEIELQRVGGVIIEADTNDHVLLGMTFLGRLDIEQSTNVMVLRKKH